MAKSKLAVVENGAEQAVVESEAGINSQSALETPAVPESREALAPELTDEEAAILAHEGEERFCCFICSYVLEFCDSSFRFKDI